MTANKLIHAHVDRNIKAKKHGLDLKKYFGLNKNSSCKRNGIRTNNYHNKVPETSQSKYGPQMLHFKEYTTIPIVSHA